MRLHHLEVTAFGPFPGTVTVDLDALSEAGLFLLSGPTGAGKTSVLDAVCFAFYGQVPGDRAAAKRLRCDTAEPDVPPRVVLETTLGGRRFRLTRSPGWQRPRKRGSGTTPAQPSVVVQERVDGAWQTLTTRQDEAGQLVSELLGMTLAQFTQVALLPQGRFQAFLRADADERKNLLERLFRTRRFADVETWLRDRRVRLRRASEEHRREVDDLLSRISESTADAVPVDREDRPALGAAAEDGSLAGWAHAWVGTASQRAQASAIEASAAHTRQAGARHRLDDARSRHERHDRLGSARAEQRRLVDAAPGHERAVAELAAARRSATALPALRQQEHTAREAQRLESRADAAVAAARDTVPGRSAGLADLGAAELTGLLTCHRDTAAEGAAAVRAALPRRAALRELEAEVGRLEADAADADDALRRARAAQAALPERVAAARSRAEAASEAAAGLAEGDAEVSALTTRLEALVRFSGLGVDLEAAREAHVAVLDQVAGAQERLVQLREARIEGMAAEIAGALAVGACCPVCGSAEHPDKAVPAAGAPDAESERGALRALEDLRVHELAQQHQVRDLAGLRDVARAEAGGDAGPDAAREVSGRLERATGRAAALRATASGLTGARDRLAALEEELDRAGTTVARATVRVATARTTLAHRAEERFHLATGLDALLDGTAAADLDELRERREEQVAACETALRVLHEAEVADRGAAEAAAELDRALREAGFPDASAVRDAHREAEAVEELVARVSDHDRRHAVVRETLADPALRDADAAPLPDLAALEAALDETVDALGVARSAESRWSALRDRLVALAADLDRRLAAWAPLRAEHATTSDLAALVEGTSADNAWRMRLSAFVLSYRLTQVVAAANERLSRMSDERYALVHTGARGVGSQRGGLGLLVRDDWSGESRDPATLSGGETFVVSLALALGLADVITAESGGAELDTLFVDEGFGSLDVDTLDDVLDTLDSLRVGGRVIGVVSHVTEMRERIPTRLEVSKGRTGSRLRVLRG